MGFEEICNSVERVQAIRDALDEGIHETEANIKEVVDSTRSLYAKVSGFSIAAINHLGANGLNYTADAILNSKEDIQKYVELCKEIEEKKEYLESLSRLLIREVAFLSGNHRTIDLRVIQATANKPM